MPLQGSLATNSHLISWSVVSGVGLWQVELVGAKCSWSVAVHNMPQQKTRAMLQTGLHDYFVAHEPEHVTCQCRQNTGVMQS